MKLSIVRFTAIAVISTSIFVACKKEGTFNSEQNNAHWYKADVAVQWMEMNRQLVASEIKNGPQAARIYAYSAMALYEAVLPGMKGYKSLGGQVRDYAGVTGWKTIGKLDFPTVINEALYRVSLKVAGFALKQSITAKLDSVYNLNIGKQRKTLPPDIFANSSDYGKKVATAILQRAENDNFSVTKSLVYTLPTSHPSYWRPTDNTNLTPLEPFWSKVKCFAMKSAEECAVPTKSNFSTVPGSAFYKEAFEVLTINQNLTAEQKNIAKWWADGGGTPAGPGHWLGIENQLVGELNLNLAKAAEMYALVGIALGDAFISCWDLKYKVNLLRPVTYIRNYIPGISNFTPIIATPPFPEYPSGHSVSSGAAAEVLTQLFGEHSFIDNTNAHLPIPLPKYTSFQEAANEAAMSRLYGGIHFREACENGLKQGKLVAQSVLKNIILK